MRDQPAIAGGRPVRKAPLPFHRLSLGAGERAAVDRVLRSGWITSGPVVSAFERACSRYLKAPHAVAVSSNTIGTTVALDALGVGPGDEVLTTPLTFVSTANVVVHRGAKPKFVDVDPETLTMDPASAKRAIGRRTKALLPVHLAGQPCDMKPLLALAKRHRLFVIEDAAHAFGAAYHGRPIGSWGDATVFSFHAVKNLTTGEGGLVTTQSAALAKKIRCLIFHGMDRDAWSRIKANRWRYSVAEAGYKANFTDIQAAIGLEQLRRFDKMQQRRRQIVQGYHRAFSHFPELILPKETQHTRHAWHVYLLRLKLDRLRITRDKFLEALAAEGITGNVHYVPVHLQPYYRRSFGCREGLCPVAEKAAAQVATLPLFPSMTDADVNDVIAAVTKLIRYYARG